MAAAFLPEANATFLPEVNATAKLPVFVLASLTCPSSAGALTQELGH